MNLDIAATAPAPTALPPTAPAVPAPGSRAGAVPTTPSYGGSAAVTNDTIPSGPPAEAMDAIAIAMNAADALAASGREMRFQLDPPTGKVTVAVHDLKGNLLSTVSPSQALDIAGGSKLD